MRIIKMALNAFGRKLLEEKFQTMLMQTLEG